MAQTVFIDGAAGTTGLEIAERLAGRSEFALVTLPDAERKDAARRAEALNGADFVILCLPDAAAIEAVAMIRNDRTRSSTRRPRTASRRIGHTAFPNSAPRSGARSPLRHG